MGKSITNGIHHRQRIFSAIRVGDERRRSDRSVTVMDAIFTQFTTMGSIGFVIFIVMTVAFFSWVAYLAISK